jgi:hypothetical protein
VFEEGRLRLIVYVVFSLLTLSYSCLGMSLAPIIILEPIDGFSRDLART